MKTLFNQTATPSMEAIQVQQPKVFQSLAEIFGRYLTTDYANHDALDREIEAVIADFTRVQKVSFVRGTGGPMAVLVDFTTNAKLIQAELQRLTKSGSSVTKIKALSEVARGWVDVKTSRVGGVFALIPMEIHFTNHIIRGKYLTPEEKAAILLHEIGHFITWYLYVARSVTTNAITAVAASDIFNSAAPTKREVLFAAIKEGMELKSVNFQELEHANNSTALTVFLLDASRKELRSELGSDIYDMVAWEALADQYAVRMGAGAELASALAKMGSSKAKWHYACACEMACVVVGALMLTSGVLALMGAGALTLAVTWMGGSSISNYDREEARLRRIRNDMQAELRNKEIDETVRRNLQARLDWVDRSIEQVKDSPTLMEIIRRFLVKSDRQRADFEELQQDLESLAANRLYEHAASLRNLY